MTKAERVDLLSAELKRFMPVFAPRGEQFVTELRALRVPGWKNSRPTDDCGFFDLGTNAGRLAIFEAIRSYAEREEREQPEGIYLVINPLDPVYLSRASNCMGKRGERISADDAHVVGRRWFVVDIDPVRPISKVSATDTEKAEAHRVALAVRADLHARGFSAPMVCDSGNGYHLWYRIDLPAADEQLVEHTLKGLALRHDTAGATVDTSTFNPSRIMKIPGTFARKGSSTADRPHRAARVIEVPDQQTEADHVQGDAA